VADVVRGQPARIHLGDEALQDVGVAVKEAHQRRVERRIHPADLRHLSLDRALGGAGPPGLVAIARADC